METFISRRTEATNNDEHLPPDRPEYAVLGIRPLGPAAGAWRASAQGLRQIGQTKSSSGQLNPKTEDKS
jgi:hypothetical protein